MIVWFKHDLRLDDHAGLQHAIASQRPVLAVFFADPALLHLDDPSEAAVVESALVHMRNGLRALNIPLVASIVPHGEAVATVFRLSMALQAHEIWTEEERQVPLNQGVAQLGALLASHIDASHIDELPKLKTWRSVLYELEQQQQQEVDSFPNHVRRRPRRPHAPRRLDALQPTAPEQGEFVERLGPLGRLPTPTELWAALGREAEASPVASTEWPMLYPADYIPSPDDQVTHLLAHQPLETLAAYCREESVPVVVQARRRLETRASPGASFHILFRPVLDWGILSPSIVYHEALKSCGLVAPILPPPSLFSDLSQRVAPLTAALRWAESRDFHTHLAASTLPTDMAHVPPPSAVTGRSYESSWRWRGLDADFIHIPATSSSSSSHDLPAIVFCHGFGAFAQHHRSNLGAMAAAGYDAYAPTLPGYGRSEKHPMGYSQYVWAHYLSSFVDTIVAPPSRDGSPRRRVILVGNSIGGFISSTVASVLGKDRVAGVVLLNSAGKIEPDFVNQVRRAGGDKAKALATQLKSPSPSPLLSEVVARVLFAYLQSGVGKTLQRLYPTAPHRADEWLGREITRASLDPGAFGVFRSAFFLPPPLPLSYNLDVFNGPVLVLQGELDPLNDSKKRARELAEGGCVSNRRIDMELIAAGHCPHDEQPDLVNAKILGWMERILA